MTSELIFTIDQKYYIKAIYRSLPHLVYGVDSNKLSYATEVVQSDFNKWRSGDYNYEEFPKQKQIVIHENERVYTFLQICTLTPSEIMWVTFDELTRMNSNIEYSQEFDDDDMELCDDLRKIVDMVFNKRVEDGGILNIIPEFNSLTVAQKVKLIKDDLTSCFDNNTKSLTTLQQKYDLLNTACTEMRSLWMETCRDRDIYSTEKRSLEKKLLELQRPKTAFDVVKVDKLISTIDIELCSLNDYLCKHATGFVIGIRGYWFGTDRISFNITQLICNNSKPFVPFSDFQLTDNRHSYPDLKAHVTCHDMLGLFNNLTLRLFYEEYHILSIDENQFISQTISQYLDYCSSKRKTELSKSLMSSSDFELDSLTYKVNIAVDTIDKNNVGFLNNLMATRRMKIIDGEGQWINPTMFVITKLVMKNAEVTETPNSDNEFEEVDHPSEDAKDLLESPEKLKATEEDKKSEYYIPEVGEDLLDQMLGFRVKAKPKELMAGASKSEKLMVAAAVLNRKLIKMTLDSIEKHFKKTTDQPNEVVIKSDSTKSVTNYNMHLLLKFAE